MGPPTLNTLRRPYSMQSHCSPFPGAELNGDQLPSTQWVDGGMRHLACVGADGKEPQGCGPPGTQVALEQQVAGPVTAKLGDGHSLVFLALVPAELSL